MLTFVLAYLFGSIPLGFLLRRFNILRLPAALVSIGADFFQGLFVAAFFPKAAPLLVKLGLGFLNYPLQNASQLGAAALLAATLGRYFSVYVCGWGGLGTALILGGFLVLAPVAALWSLCVLGFVLLIFRKLRFASLLAGFSLPFFVGYFYRDNFVYLGAAAVLALEIVLTHTNFFSRDAKS